MEVDQRNAMTTILLAKRITITNGFKASLKHKPPHVCFSNAFERAEGSKGMSETRGEGTGPDGTPGTSSGAGKDPVSQSMYEAKQQALDMDEKSRTGAAQFVADTAKEGVRKATEMADVFGDPGKKTMDGAWEASKEANEKIRERVVGDNSNGNRNSEEDPIVVEPQKIDGPIDTVEYRNVDRN